MFKIMIVEDDETMNAILAKNLIKWKFSVLNTINFEAITDSVIAYQPHLILLDINLPFFDGFHWCRQIRQMTNVPVIFISSRDSTMDKIMAMNMGGDDYIQKPIEQDILIAKIHALLRRTYAYGEFEAPHVLEYHEIILHLDDSRISHRGQSVDLTTNEFRILSLLMRQVGKIVSREQIIKALWEDAHFIDDNTLTVNIVRLRRKLSEIGLRSLIQTKKGQGYQIR
ncbi:MAG: response regulator transcription factor [Sporolactobacillus sp.]